MSGAIKVTFDQDDDSYTVRRHRYGFLIKGSLTADDLGMFAERMPKAVLHPGIADYHRVTFAITGQPKEWVAEIDAALAQSYPDDVELQWLTGPWRGRSSYLLYSVLGQKHPLQAAEAKRKGEGALPRDGDDWLRCFKCVELLDASDRLHEMSTAYPAWKSYVDGWEALVFVYRAFERLKPGRKRTNFVANYHSKLCALAASNAPLPSVAEVKEVLKAGPQPFTL